MLASCLVVVDVGFIHFIVLVPGVLSLDRPDARRANSFDSPFSQVDFVLVLMRCLYSNSFPVDSSNIALTESLRGRMLRSLVEGGRGRTDKG